MNILPKKRWHVRNRENIARVRRDEAQAAQEEKEKQERIKLAETEARRELLLQRSRSNVAQLSGKEFISLNSVKKDEDTTGEHVNFFKDLEEGSAEFKKTNKEHEKEQKEEREKYEKQIGYLTYLGQDTNEALGKRSWYECVPDRKSADAEINLKSKLKEDPLEIIKKYAKVGKAIDAFRNEEKLMKYKPILEKLDKEKRQRKNSCSDDDTGHRHKRHKCKKRRKSSSVDCAEVSEGGSEKIEKSNKRYKPKKMRKSSSDESSEESEDEREKIEKQRQLEIMRIERLRREKAERKRTEELLNKLRGAKKEATSVVNTNFKPKYNSQFNPELAKQNYVRR